MDIHGIITVAGVVALGSFVQGITGFGFSILSVSILCQFFPPVYAVGSIALLATVNSAALFWLMRRDVQYKPMLVFVVLSFLTIPAGVFFLTYVDRTIFMLSLGIVILVLTIVPIIVRHPALTRVLESRWFGYGASIVSGFFGGAFSIPGPPMIAYLYNSDSSKIAAKANVQFYFTAIDALIIPAYIASGVITAKTATASAIAAPIVVLFTWLGLLLARRMSTAVFNTTATAALIALGAFIIIKTAVGG